MGNIADINRTTVQNCPRRVSEFLHHDPQESGLLSSGKTAMQLAKNGKYANPAVLELRWDVDVIFITETI